MPQYNGTYTAPRLDLGAALEQYPITQPGFIGMQVLAPFDTVKKSGSFVAVTRESILRARNVKRAPKSAYSRDDHEIEPVSYECEEFGHEQLVDDSERAMYASDYDADETAARVARDVLLREQEKRVADAIFNTTTWTGASLTTDLSTDWDAAASTIVSDVDAAKELVRKNCGLMPNTLIVSAAVLPWFKSNTDLKSRLQYVVSLTDSAIVGALPGIFGIDKVLIAGGIQNASLEGTAASLSDIWNDNYCWIGVTANPGAPLTTPCVGRTMAWTGDGGLYTVDQYREEQTRTDVFRVRQYVDELVIDPNFGHLLVIDT